MLHFRRRNLRLPDLTVKRDPDLLQFRILQNAKHNNPDHQSDQAGAKTLEEHPPDFGQRKYQNEQTQTQKRRVTHDDRSRKNVKKEETSYGRSTNATPYSTSPQSNRLWPKLRR